MTDPQGTSGSTSQGRQINAIDATNGAAAIGDGARAVHAGAGGTYIEQQTVVIQERPRVEPNLFQVPFPRSDHFVGREEDLARIHALLSGREQRPVGLCGLGGIGKTQLAVEYAYRHREDYAGGIFWLTAADPWTWQAGLAEIATRLGLRVPDPDKSDAQMRLAGELAAYLNGHPNALLIFDNVEAPADLNVSRVQDFIFAALGCRTLFTTRRRAADLPFAWLEVGRLPEDASLALLLRHESRRLALDPAHPDHGAGRELCRRLGYLPLTLELAGAFLARNLRVTIPAYLTRIGKEGVLATVDRTHLRPEDLPTGHEPSIVATLAMQWEALADDAARRALQTAALLGEAEQIPRARLALLTGLPDTAEEGYASPLEDALASLRDLSLVEDLTADEVRQHPLVREFVAGQIADRAAFIEAAVASLSEALWDVERLEAEVRARGVDAVVADLRAAMGLTPGPSPERRERGGEAGVRPLLRALDLDSHILRGWNPETEPAFFLQQWRNRCFEMGWDEPVRQAEALLAARNLSYFRELRHLGADNPALLRHLNTPKRGNGYSSSLKLREEELVLSQPFAEDNIIVWDIPTGATRGVISSQPPYDTASISADGNTAVSTGWPYSELQEWDLHSCELRQTIPLVSHFGKRWLEPNPEHVERVRIAPDNRTVATQESFQVRIWDLVKGTRLRTLKPKDFFCSPTALHSRFCILAGNKGLQVWDLETGSLSRTLHGEAWIDVMEVSRDGRLVITGCRDSTIKVWDLNSGVCTRTLTGHRGKITALDMTPDGQTAVSGSEDKTVRVWDLSTGACVRAFSEHPGGIWSVSIREDGKMAVSGSYNIISVWDLTADISPQAQRGHSDAVSIIAMAPNGHKAVSGSDDHTLKVWDTNTGLCAHTLSGHTERLCGIGVTQDSQLIVSDATDNTFRVWELATGACLHTLFSAQDKHDQHKLWFDKRSLHLSDDTWRLQRTMKGHSALITTATFLRNERLALSGSADKTLRVWDLATGRCLQILRGHTAGICCVTASPDREIAVSGADDGVLKVWSLIDGICLNTIQGHQHRIVSTAITADGQFAVSASVDHEVKIWNLATGECMNTVYGYRRATSLDEFYGRYFRSAWFVPARQKRAVESLLTKLPADIREEVIAVAMDPDERAVITLSKDYALRLWSMASGKCKAKLTTAGQFTSCATTATCRYVVAGDALGGVHFIECILRE